MRRLRDIFRCGGIHHWTGLVKADVSRMAWHAPFRQDFYVQVCVVCDKTNVVVRDSNNEDGMAVSKRHL